MKVSAFAGPGFERQRAAVRGHDVSCQRQALPRPLAHGLGREEWDRRPDVGSSREYRRRYPPIETVTMVPSQRDTDANQAARALGFADGVRSVDNQIQKHLIQPALEAQQRRELAVVRLGSRPRILYSF